MRRSRLLVVAAAAALLVVPLGANAQDEEMVDVAGTSLSIFGASTGVEGEALGAFMEVYNQEKGTDINYTGSDSFEQQLRIQVEGGNPPEIAVTPQPGSICEFADAGHLASLEDMGFDRDTGAGIIMGAPSLGAPIFADGFESGDATAWTDQTP